MKIKKNLIRLFRLAPDREDITQNWREYLAAGLSGGILRLAFPQPDLGWLAWVGLVPLFWALRRQTGKAAFYRGWFFGFVFYYGISFFLNTLHVFAPVVVIGIVALGLIQGLYAGVFAWGVGVLGRKSRKSVIWFAPAWWTLLESIRSSGELGFPFGALAHSQYNQTGLIQLVSLTGTGALSFLIVWINGLVADLFFDDERPIRRRALDCTVGLTALATVWGAGYGVSRIDLARGDTFHLTLIQPSVPQIEKWNSYMMYPQSPATAMKAWDAMARQIVEMTDEALAAVGSGAEGSTAAPDMIIWPETAIPDFFFNVSEGAGQPPRYAQLVEEAAVKWRTPILMGAARQVMADDGRRAQESYNSAYVFTPTGGMSDQTYDKIHLVPFGEDMSYLRFIPYIEAIGLTVGSFDRGKSMTVFEVRGAETQQSMRFSTLICFESTMPYLFRRAARAGAEFMVVVTNDGWYGVSSGPKQHQIQSIFRAVETGRWVVRCANNGISCFISPQGRIARATELNEIGSLSASIYPRTGQTPYVRIGPWFGWLCFILCGVGLGRAVRRKPTPDL